jgi:acetolactate synthase-1/2/3 large subunit
VWLDVPMDVQYAAIDSDRIPGYTPPPDPLADLDLGPSVDAVVELLRTAKRPLLIGGHGVRQAGAVEDFRHFVQESRTPVILSRLGQDMLPFSHPLNFGQAGLKGSKYCGFIMRSADLVIALGCRLAVQLVGHRFDAFSSRAKVVAVDIEADELKKPGLRVDLPVLADVRAFLPQLRRALAGARLPDRTAWVDYCREVKDRHPMITPDRQRNPIDLYYFMHRLDAASGPQHIFVTDAGSNYYVGGQVYRFEHGQREVTSGTFAAMGLSIPLAIGAAVAAPEAQILAVTGDGSLELNIQELKTVSSYGLNVKLFVINNGGYLSMRNWQDGFFEGRRIGSDAATGAESLDLPKIAAAFDLPYSRIGRYEEIDERLREILGEGGPRFVEVVCDDRQEIAGPLKEGWASAGGDE